MVWSNSFLFLTLRKALPLNGKKKRPDLDAFLFGMQHCFARCSGCFLFETIYNLTRFCHSDDRREKNLDNIYVDCINECLQDFWDRVFNSSSSLNSEWHLVEIQKISKTPTSNSEAHLSPSVEDRPLVEEREENRANFREEQKAVWAKRVLFV